MLCNRRKECRYFKEKARDKTLSRRDICPPFDMDNCCIAATDDECFTPHTSDCPTSCANYARILSDFEELVMRASNKYD